LESINHCLTQYYSGKIRAAVVFNVSSGRGQKWHTDPYECEYNHESQQIVILPPQSISSHEGGELEIGMFARQKIVAHPKLFTSIRVRGFLHRVK
jgi:hypothetical protein